MTLIPTHRRKPSAPHAARAGVGREGGRWVRLALPFALLVAIVNALVYQGGDTLLVRGGDFLGRRWDVTLEAAAEGVFVGLRIVVLIAALGGLMSAAVDPDQLLKALRRVSYRSALTATLATRLVPVLAGDAGRMGDARRCRPHPPGRLAVVRAALAGALDRAVDVAAALEVRGYAPAGRPAHARRPWSCHDLRLAPAALLAGVSGSGKSTLLRALCGLVPHFHGGEAAGELVVGGLDVRERGPGELAAVCGTVFQEPETQVVMGGVRAELELPLEHRGEPRAALARAVEETALALGVGHLLERRTDTLSGGELQRVALAAAMVHGPELLLLDEPTSQLDPVAGDELVWLLRRLNEDWGTAVVVAEHRLERCLPAADRVIALVEGRVACDAAPAEHLAWAADAMPVLATPAARLFSLAGLPDRPASVKEARAGLSEAGIEARSQRDADGALAASRDGAAQLQAPRRRRRGPAPALALRGVWLEIEDGPTVLRGLELELRAGERVALMGRNGA